MSSHTLYCNEQMLLDNWKYYDEPNMLLKNTLRKTSLSPTECATFYYENMKNQESVTYDREHLISMFSSGRNKLKPLLIVDQIALYEKDLEYVESAKKDYHLNYAQVKALFGVIFFCRLFGTKKISLDTSHRLKQFSGCFQERTSSMYWHGSNWDNGYTTIIGLQQVSDEYHLLLRSQTDNIGCVYEYPEFELTQNDKVSYIYKVTKETNKVQLSGIVRKMFDPRDCYCVICGTPYHTEGPNASLYCKACAKEKERIRLMIKNRSKSNKPKSTLTK